MTPLLEVRDLRVEFPGPAGAVHPVDGVSFQLERGETLALVGESGSGKSLTGLALLRLVPAPGTIGPGSAIRLDGVDLLALQGEALRRVRGGRIGLVFQDPMTSLNPVLTAGYQVQEAVTAHTRLSRAEARERALALLDEVGIPDPRTRYSAYPHELSGGLRQRVMLAIALAARPDILIADEPTTALDVTVQAQILELLDRLRAARGMAVLLITHDFGIVAGRADRIAVMYAGQLVEQGPTRAVFRKAQHPYTRALLASIPRLTGPVEPINPIPGTVPLPAAWPSGCRFHPRCPRRFEPCDGEPPDWTEWDPGHHHRCYLPPEGSS